MGWLCPRPSPEHTSVSPWPRLFQAHGEGEPEKKEVSELRSELWEKEMKLTDIRLEALNSAHQLEQLRETMHNMQVGVAALPRALSWLLGTASTRLLTRPVLLFFPQLEVDLLKAENDRLKVAPGPSAVPGSIPGHITSTSASSSPRRSLGLSLGHAFSPSPGDAGRAGGAACADGCAESGSGWVYSDPPTLLCPQTCLPWTPSVLAPRRMS